ncbi:glycoside hydrolase family 16 protein [Winogradskyella marincola]|uniref:Glycoside hydrolase family 16 protein n=1 Tax=Winogradskyella marincola TaxID=3037795 RepID=A0ABT6G1E8_9FLAO|nr:glycoside hydrolase family 16 protein [Winogradskyella sp. YYF002]MDG4715867.1 glycoside hydrolase family 16 protein [Winogradskyella sp. YYF002]
MKNLNIKLNVLIIAVLATFFSCQDDDASIGEIVAPTNLSIEAVIVGQDADNPYGDGSGVVNLYATADNASSYKFLYSTSEVSAPSGQIEALFTNLGVNTYTVTVIAYGTGGLATTATTEVEVLATYSPPEDLIEKLVGDSSKTWRLKSEANGHFGLGPVGGQIPVEWYGAGPEEKVGVGMYDDRFIFNIDGTYTHITNNTNDDPTTDVTGTIFGRDGLVDEIGSGGTVNGADVENLPYDDYTSSYSLIAPGGVETISLNGLSFISYYTGGSHNYQIFDRSVENELLLKTTDGNNEFDWWFILTSEEPSNEEFASVYNNLVWQDEFDVNGAPDPSNWTYDLGTGTDGWGNLELQHYTDRPENVIVEDGMLKITAKAESFSGSDYTSSRIKSQDLYEFTYGRVEFRAKLPEGGGTWPALWMLGANFEEVGWPNCGEIDVMEHVGNSQNTIHGTLHLPGNSGGNAVSGTTTNPTASSEFHLYSVEWRPGEIIFLVDNEPFFTFDNDGTLPFNSDFFLIINFAMGGNFGGAVDPAFVESTLEVDYVRVYQ